MPAGGRQLGDYNLDSRVVLAFVREFLLTHRRVTPRTCLYHVVSAKLAHPKTGMIIIPTTAEKYEVKFYTLLSRARVAGDIDDEPFVDDHCSVEKGGLRGWSNLEEYLELPDIDYYHRNHWRKQPKHVTEVWLEKNTIAELVRPAIRKWDCTLRIASGGYGRAFLYQAANELHAATKPITILYCGDFDPAGLDIERAARKGNDKEGGRRREGLEDILIKRFAWTAERFADQVFWKRIGATENDLNNPEFAPYLLSVKQAVVQNPADPTKEKKKGDTRGPAYIGKYGDRCLEIEALEVLEADSLANRLDSAIQLYGVDVEAWRKSERKEAREKQTKRSVR